MLDMRKLGNFLSRCFRRSSRLGLLLLCLLLFEQSACDAAAPEAATRTRVIFVGDIMAHIEQLERPRSTGSWDFSPQFRRVKPLFKDALAVGNLETVFAGGKNFTGYPAFNTPDELAPALADLGLCVVTLGNNHILDKGASGAARTTRVLNDAGILWTGLGYGEAGPNEALTFERDGVRWAFLSYSYASNRILTSSDVHLNTISEHSVTEGLRNARLASPDITVACFHWGNEYQFTPTKRQIEIAALCLENGADLVIGTHPHVLQPIEIVRSSLGDRVVAYSLGNFVSYQRTLPRERSVVLAVDFDKSQADQTNQKFRVSRVSVAPTWVSVTREKGGRLVEVVYAGESPRFNHAGLGAASLKAARAAGKAVLDFLGATGEADAEGFYTIWDAASPDVMPKATRKSPM